MRKLCLLATVLPVALVYNARAATTTISQAFGGGGDFALGEGLSDNFMPTFDGSLGTLQSVRIGISAILSWSEPIIVEVPPSSTFQLAAGVFLNEPLGVGSGEIDALPRTWTVNAPGGFNFSEDVHLHGSFGDNPSIYLDASNPPDLEVTPFGFVNEGSCIGGCVVDFSDDANGFIDGTLTTTFTYTPSDPPGDPPGDPVPEPASWGLMAVGLLGLAGARRIRS